METDATGAGYLAPNLYSGIACHRHYYGLQCGLGACFS